MAKTEDVQSLTAHRISKSDRHERIIFELSASPTLRASELASTLGVSHETIRRDLMELDNRGLINRTYGGAARHGGGAFSGKDPTKVDRSASYMARYVAKNCVAGGLAYRVQVQLAYAIGVADPVSVLIDTFGTAQLEEDRISELVREHFALTPKGIIDTLDLRRPIYRQTAAFGHFGRTEPEFTWERTDKAEPLRRAAGL